MTPFNHLKMQPIEKDFDESCGVVEEDNNPLLLQDLTDVPDEVINTPDHLWGDILIDE